MSYKDDLSNISVFTSCLEDDLYRSLSFSVSDIEGADKLEIVTNFFFHDGFPHGLNITNEIYVEGLIKKKLLYFEN